MLVTRIYARSTAVHPYCVAQAAGINMKNEIKSHTHRPDMMYKELARGPPNTNGWML